MMISSGRARPTACNRPVLQKQPPPKKQQAPAAGLYLPPLIWIGRLLNNCVNTGMPPVFTLMWRMWGRPKDQEGQKGLGMTLRL